MKQPSKMQQRLAIPKHLRNKAHSVFTNPKQIKVPGLTLDATERSVLFMSRYCVRSYNFQPNDVLISISDCDGTAPMLTTEPKASLVLNFNAWVTREERNQGIKEFDKAEAEKIAVFLKQNTESGNIVVHCNQGEQRSRAVAVSIATYFNLKYYTVNNNQQVVHADDRSCAPEGEYGYLLYRELDKQFDD